ncbi:protein kinase domain-containing protein [Plantactinospora sp. CA-290183]|uniref:serine/threonine-protein kinase n=1 Tax=Plantactinospora sp. CA-290183 TaxID=3240006 RepID=UPI003D8B65E4
MLSPGLVLNDRYLLNERVATGGMGEVWSATDTLLRRRVAVKVLLPSLVSDTEFITRFRTEARLMAAVRHPGIVQVYDYVEDTVVESRRVDYLVMEYIEGVPLSERIRAAGKLDTTETISVVTQAARALQVAHAAGIVHRDVKPSNLLVQPDGSVVLVDFGVARSANVTSITGTNIVLGSAHYMAPEQIAGRPVSPATDIYALGAVAYCCLTGRPPFTGNNPLQVVTQHLQEAPPALPAEVPVPVATLVSRALAKEPGDRHPSAAAFSDAARAALSGTAGTVPAGTAGATFPGATLPGATLPGATVPGTGGAPHGVGTVASPAGNGEPTMGLGPHGHPELRSIVPTSSGRNRRRNAALAGAAGAVAVALVGLVAVMAFRPSGGGEQPTDLVTGVQGGSPVTGADVDDTGVQARARATAQPHQSVAAPEKSVPVPPEAEPTRVGKPKPTATRTGTSPSNPYTAGRVCGSGYQVIDSATLTRDGTVQGRVYLLYNAGSGYNCTVALKAASVGAKTAVSTYLEVQGGARSTDRGSYAYYAGPVRARAAGVCVRWGGSAGGASYNSAFEHCD